jgi:hypothetical protein
LNFQHPATIRTTAIFMLVTPGPRRPETVMTQEGRRMIRGSSRRLRIDSAETQLTKIKLVNKDVNHANRIIFVDPVVQDWRLIFLAERSGLLLRLERHCRRAEIRASWPHSRDPALLAMVPHCGASVVRHWVPS